MLLIYDIGNYIITEQQDKLAEIGAYSTLVNRQNINMGKPRLTEAINREIGPIKIEIENATNSESTTINFNDNCKVYD